MKTEAIDEVPNRGEHQWQHKENVPGGGSSSQDRKFQWAAKVRLYGGLVVGGNSLPEE